MAIESKYFLFTPKHKSEITSAYAPEGTKLAHELISEIKDLDEMPFEFTLVKLSTGKEGIIESEDLSGLAQVWLDYQPNSLAWPLMSLKLKSVIEGNLTGKEGIEWISAKINANGEQKTYYIPRFVKKLDVLNKEKTLFVPGTDSIIKPCYALAKIQEYSVFHKPSLFWQITSGFYISATLKKAIQKVKLTGVSFERTLVV